MRLWGSTAHDGRAADPWHAAVVVGAVALGLGTPLVVITATGDQLEHPSTAAALRAAWIGLYAVVGLWFARRRRHRLLGLAMTAVGLASALASLDALPGAGPYTVSRVFTVLVVPLALLMVVSMPEARPVRRRLGPPLLLSTAVSLVLAVAYMLVAETAPWSTAAGQCRGACAGSAIQVADAPGLARAILVAMVVVLLAAMSATGVGLVLSLRGASPITARTVRPVALLTWVWLAPLYPGLVALAIDPEAESLTPWLVTVAAIRALLPLGLMAVVVAQALRTSAVGEEMMARLAGATDPGQVQSAIASVLRDPSVRLAFRDGEGWIDVDGHPFPDATTNGRGWIAMSLSGGQAGALTFDPGLHTQEERVQAIAALGTVALDRARSDAELRAVRRRLVSVADQERRRIERNLHDGAQQRLVGMAIRMAAARDTVSERPEQALALLQELGGDVQQALEELRELAHGLYPPVLVDLGLPAALRSAARHAPLPVDVRATDVGRLEAPQEAAVYFCCAEALQNAAKHAGPGASTEVRLWRDGDAVAFEVSDDGGGFVAGPLRPGTGLMGMRDRMEDVGGTLDIDSAPGRGTRVSGRLPVAAPPVERADDGDGSAPTAAATP